MGLTFELISDLKRKPGLFTIYGKDDLPGCFQPGKAAQVEQVVLIREVRSGQINARAH